jgi:hypothetical protein
MKIPFDRSSIPGWGADLDRTNRPGVPMERTPPRLDGVHWTEPEAQQTDVEILQSTEHFRRPPVFGTSVPPRGISGWMRRRAFAHSENDLRHWLILLAADRVDVVEGLAADAARSPATRHLAYAAGAVVVGMWLMQRRVRRE